MASYSELSGTGEKSQRRAVRLIGYAFAALAVYLLVQSTVVLAVGFHLRHSLPGIVWTAVTAAAMFALAAGKSRTGRALANPVLVTEGRVTAVDGILAVAVLLGLTLNAAAGWWWADPPGGTCWCSTPSARCGISSLSVPNEPFAARRGWEEPHDEGCDRQRVRRPRAVAPC